MSDTRHSRVTTARKRRKPGASSTRGPSAGPRGKAQSKQIKPPPEESVADNPEIDTIEFGHLASLVGYRIRRANTKVFQSFNEMFAPLNIAFGQYSLLALIGLNPGLSQMALADAGGIDRSTVVPITDRFVRLGWVRRSRRRQDRRMYSLKVTPAGQALLDRAHSLIISHDEQLVAGLSKEEQTQLVELLARVSNERVPALRPKQTGSRR
jgi:DNA-binding MarR family transcriptional regulator